MKKRMIALASFLRRNKVFTKSLSFVLSLVLIFYVIPSTIYIKAAEALDNIGNDAADATDVSVGIDNSINTDSVLDGILFEATELREENVKHFRLSDGNYIAAQYNYPVHYSDENGEWQDIDNTLHDSGAEFSSSDARIKFAKKITGNSSLFTLHDGSSKITLSLIGAEKGTVGEVKNNEDAKTDTELQKMMHLEKLSASVIYRDILDGVDIEYVAHSKNIKENIIVKKKQDSYSYLFELKLNGLTPTLTESGDIELSDDTTGEIKYTIPAPVVFDTSGEYAPTALSAYTLTHESGNKYTLTVTVDSAWMNAEERAFPVTVDPTVKSDNMVIDTYIDSSFPTDFYDGSTVLYVDDTKHSYWKITDFPFVPLGAHILKAELTINATADTSEGSYVGIYEVLSSWGTELTWDKYSTQDIGIFSDLPINYCIINGEGPYCFDLTETVSKWYYGADGGYIEQYGLAFAAISGYTANVQFYSNEYESSRPTLTITYRDMKGVEPYWPYSSHSTDAGSGSINLANGNLVFKIPTLSATDNLFGFTPTLVYNSAIFNKKYINNATVKTAISKIATGYGFKLNACESIVRMTSNIDPENPIEYYIYADADGTQHELHATENIGVYRDTEGLGLRLDIYTDALVLHDDTKTVRRFLQIPHQSTLLTKSEWYLSEIEDINGNKLVFTVDSYYRPATVCILPAGESTNIELLKLIYDSAGMLCAVYNPTSKHSVIFRYSTEYNGQIDYAYCNYLRRVEYCYGNSATAESDVLSFATSNTANANITVYETRAYEYDDDGKLIRATNTSTDTSLEYVWDGYRIIKVSEYASDTLGSELAISYGTGYAKIRSRGNDEILDTSDDILTCYTLDGYGRAVSTYSYSADGHEIYGGVSGVYDSQEDSKNSIIEKTVLGHVRPNLLKNGDFEGYTADSPILSNWIVSGGATKEIGNFVDNPESLLLSVSPTESTAATVSQSLSLAAGEYTFSLQHRTKSCENISGKVEIINQTSSEVLYSANISLNESSAEMTDIFSTSFTLASSARIDLKISFSATGTVNSAMSIRIGDAKLEAGSSISDYTAVNAGGFDTELNPSLFWSANVGEISVHTDSETDEDSLKLTANGALNYVKQNLLTRTAAELDAISSNDIFGANPMTQFAVSGYAKADRPLSNSHFQIYVDVTYYVGESVGSFTERYPFEFSYISDEWQYVSGTFCLSKRATGVDLPNYLCVQSVDIVCDYSYQLFGCAYFEDISLTYIGLDKSTRTVYDNGLVVKTDDGSYCTYYEYDENRNVTRIADNNGILVDYHYKTDESTGELTNLVDYTIEYTYTYDGSTLLYPYNKDNPDDLIVKTMRLKTVYSYNAYGMVTEVVTYSTATGDPYTLADDFTKQAYTYETTAGSKIFGAVLTEKNTDYENIYFYDSSTGWLMASCNIKAGNGYIYTYDEAGRLSKVDPAIYTSYSGYSVVSGSSGVEYEYNSANRLSDISTYSTEYTFGYDIFGNSESISIGDIELASYEYDEYNGKLKKITYGNGYEVEYIYNKREQTEAVRYRTNASSEYITAYEYEYTSDGQLHILRDNINSRVTVYKYDEYDRLAGISEYEDNEDVIHTEISYDSKSRVESMDSYLSYTYLTGGGTVNSTDQINYTYSYLDDGRLGGYSISGGFTSNAVYSYDTLDRISSVVYTNSANGSSISASEVYEYNIGATYGAGAIVLGYVNTVGTSALSYTHSYNGNGNITKTVYNDVNEVVYGYDLLQRLVTEDNDITGYYYTYTYDNAGNLTKVTKQPQGTTDDDGLIQMGVIEDGAADTSALRPILPLVTTNTYSYTNTEWGDLLTSFNGTAITYDEIGNPLSYYNGLSYTFTWDGRRLATATKGTNTMSFAYNSDGLRISKTVNGVTTYFIYEGDLLIAEYTDTRAIVYIYDVNGSPIGFKCRKSTYAENVWDVYWYGKNLQGDIVAIYSSTGTILATYKYNAWGETTKIYSNGGASTTAAYSNLTYRGYYYDTDLSMYYLQSRYYDPAVCRFINADAYISTGHSIAGYNMFAYCNNNPVNRVDHIGTFPIAISMATIVLVACSTLVVALAATHIKYASNDKEKNNSLGDVTEAEISVADSKKTSASYTVYCLKDPKTDKIEYVGRTSNPYARKKAHQSSLTRGHLIFVVLEDNLSKSEARGLEQYYMILHHTLNASNKQNNQINGISLSNPMLPIYVESVINYIGNNISNEFLNWAGI